MVKLIEESHASLSARRHTEIIMPGAHPCVCAVGTGCRSFNYLHRTVVPSVYRFNLSCSKRSIVWNVERLSLRQLVFQTKRNVHLAVNSLFNYVLAGETVRHVVGVVAVRGWKKQMPTCNGKDRARNMAQSKTRGIPPLGSRCPRPTGVPSRENLENLWRWESKWRLRCLSL